jgi:hypothetical protein
VDVLFAQLTAVSNARYAACMDAVAASGTHELLHVRLANRDGSTPSTTL